MINGPVAVVVLLVSIGYFVVDAVKTPIQKAGHAICHVVTFGHKCDPPAPAPLCPPGLVFEAGDGLHGCFAPEPAPISSPRPQAQNSSCLFLTTMDGLPLCAGVPMTAPVCLQTYPPDAAGGFCEFYGYATKEQEIEFERQRGYRRVVHVDGSGDTWRRSDVPPQP